MGTYTTNYQLYTPTVGETGWGTLVNGNFTTIDTTMKSLSDRITAVENEVNGALSCTSVTTSGKITGNGGIAGTTGTFSGAVTGSSFNGVVLKSSGTITVTPLNTSKRMIQTNTEIESSIVVLPLLPNHTYTGTIRIYNNSSGSRNVYWYNGSRNTNVNAEYWYSNMPGSGYYDITFTNIPYLAVQGDYTYSLSVGNFTLS